MVLSILKHLFFSGKNVCQCEDYIDAAKSLGDVSDSPTGMSAKPSHSRPQVQHSISIENEFQYKLSHKERGCFIIFNIEVGEYVSVDILAFLLFFHFLIATLITLLLSDINLFTSLK